MKNENQTRDLLSVKIVLNALYDSEYGGGFDQLEVCPHSPKSYLIKLEANRVYEEIPADLVERYIADKEYDKDQDPGVAKWLKDVEGVKKKIIKIFEELRKSRVQQS